MNLNLELSAEQTLALTACMFAVARIDGVHPDETALIQQFYEGSRRDGMPPFAEVQQLHANALPMLKQLPASDTFNEALLSMCLMTGYADGNLSDGERGAIQGFGRAVGVDDAKFEEILQQVRDSLLESLASLPDAESVAALAKEL